MSKLIEYNVALLDTDLGWAEATPFYYFDTEMGIIRFNVVNFKLENKVDCAFAFYNPVTNDCDELKELITQFREKYPKTMLMHTYNQPANETLSVNIVK